MKLVMVLSMVRTVGIKAFQNWRQLVAVELYKGLKEIKKGRPLELFAVAEGQDSLIGWLDM